MISRRIFLPSILVLLLPPFFQTTAAPRITFEVLATFDYPDADNTYAEDINDDGVVAGFFTDRARYEGFVRFGDRFSAPIIEPDDVDDYTRISGISNTGTLCGYYVGPKSDFYGFLLSGSNYTTIDLSDHHTILNGINDIRRLRYGFSAASDSETSLVHFCGSFHDLSLHGWHDVGHVSTKLLHG